MTVEFLVYTWFTWLVVWLLALIFLYLARLLQKPLFHELSIVLKIIGVAILLFLFIRILIGTAPIL